MGFLDFVENALDSVGKVPVYRNTDGSVRKGKALLDYEERTGKSPASTVKPVQTENSTAKSDSENKVPAPAEATTVTAKAEVSNDTNVKTPADPKDTKDAVNAATPALNETIKTAEVVSSGEETVEAAMSAPRFVNPVAQQMAAQHAANPKDKVVPDFSSFVKGSSNNPVINLMDKNVARDPSIVSTPVAPKIGLTAKVDVAERLPKVLPSIVNKPADAPQVEPPAPTVATYTNEDIKAAYPKLAYIFKEIEAIALSMKQSVEFQECLGVNGARIGMIYGIVHGASGAVIPPKNFTIDNGNIIDGRVKFFPTAINMMANTSNMTYEDWPAYHLVSDDKQKKFNPTYITMQLQGGGRALPQNGCMHRPNYRELNKFLDLRSMPTRSMSPDSRRELQSRLTNALSVTDAPNVFVEAIKLSGSRFKFGEYKNIANFTLVSNAPNFYGAIAPSLPEVQIRFKQGNAVILTADELAKEAVEEKAAQEAKAIQKANNTQNKPEQKKPNTDTTKTAEKTTPDEKQEKVVENIPPIVEPKVADSNSVDSKNKEEASK